MLVVAPFGLLFGTVGTDAGLSTLEVMAFSVLVIAGASQFAALQLLTPRADRHVPAIHCREDAISRRISPQP